MSVHKLIQQNQDLFFSFKRHYFAFGWVVLRNVFDQPMLERLTNAADILVKQQPECVLLPNGQPFPKTPIGGPVERSNFIADIIFESPILDFIRFIFDDKFYYYSSHLSYFLGGSSWHKDTGYLQNWLKANIYLSEPANDLADGNFLIVPGSHHPNSSYSSHVQRVLDGTAGELAKGRLHAPEFNLASYQMSFGFPFTEICLNAGDVLFFDTRTIHTVRATRRLRRLIGVNFIDRAVSREFPKFTPRESLLVDDDYFYRARTLSTTIETKVNGRRHTYNYPNNFYDSSKESVIGRFLLRDMPTEFYENIYQSEFARFNSDELMKEFWKNYA